MQLTINGVVHEVDVEPEMPLLWVLREELGMRGTKFGCGMGLCGACTVHLDGKAVRSCTLPVADVGALPVTTIEGLSEGGLHPIQQSWITHQVPQCGYCQPGMQMAAAALLAENPEPTRADIEARITNICRCGCYQRIEDAILDTKVGV